MRTLCLALLGISVSVGITARPQSALLGIAGTPANPAQNSISWTGGGVLEQSPTLSPPAFHPSPNQSNPQMVNFGGSAMFFRVSQTAGAWQPPIGIPYPPFGI